MLTQFKTMMKNEDGATAIEYGLIAALIAVAIVGTLALVGPKLSTTFGKVNTALDSANGTAAQ